MLNQFEFIDDIANELDIDAEHVKANIEKYGLNGDKLDHRNGVWYDSKEDGDFNDKISRIHMRYDENADYHRLEQCFACSEDFGDDIGSVVSVKIDGEKVFICNHCDKQDAMRDIRIYKGTAA